MKEVFVLDNAPVAEPGEKAIHSKPGIYLTNGTEMTIEVVDGRYTLDEDDDARRHMLKASLLAAGFRSARIFPDEPAKDKPAKVRDKLDHTIELVHPDNTRGNLIDATVRAAGKRIKVEAGIAKTDDPKVIEALQRKGFIVQNPHTLEREEEKHPPPVDPEAYPEDPQEPQEPMALDPEGEVPDPESEAS